MLDARGRGLIIFFAPFPYCMFSSTQLLFVVTWKTNNSIGNNLPQANSTQGKDEASMILEFNPFPQQLH